MKERYAIIEEAMAWAESAIALMGDLQGKDLEDGANREKMNEAQYALISATYALMMAKSN